MLPFVAVAAERHQLIVPFVPDVLVRLVVESQAPHTAAMSTAILMLRVILSATFRPPFGIVVVDQTRESVLLAECLDVFEFLRR